MNKRTLRFLAILLVALLLIAQPAQADPPHCSHVPAGTILAWHGDADALPRGFILCDGDNGSPDLRGKFLMGADTDYPPGSVGGQNIVSHNHWLEHTPAKGFVRNGMDENYALSTDSIMLDNRPEFMAVHFIMCVGK